MRHARKSLRLPTRSAAGRRRTGPLAPEESQKLFRVPHGLRVELVASEPYVADPVAMAFDARGRILVCEIHGYNLEGYLDVLELNKTGELDRQVRRIPATDEAIRRARKTSTGRSSVWRTPTATDAWIGSTVLADRLPPCYGVVPARDGVIVFCAPDIVFLRDADDDGQAEEREMLFTGFGVGELWTRINNPRWGVDNWIYGVSGRTAAARFAARICRSDVTDQFRLLPLPCGRQRLGTGQRLDPRIRPGDGRLGRSVPVHQPAARAARHSDRTPLPACAILSSPRRISC